VIWLLDTNIVIHALNGVPAVRDRLNAATVGDRIATSTAVLAELYTHLTIGHLKQTLAGCHPREREQRAQP